MFNVQGTLPMFRFSLLLQEGDDPLSVNLSTRLTVLMVEPREPSTISSDMCWSILGFNIPHLLQCNTIYSITNNACPFQNPFKGKMNSHYWTEKWLLWPVQVVFNCIKQNMIKKTVATFQTFFPHYWISNVNTYM